MTRRPGTGWMGAGGLDTITGKQESLAIIWVLRIFLVLIILGQDSGMTSEMPLL